MRAYLYFTWGNTEEPEGFSMLKQAMLHEVSDHIVQLGHKGFLFLTKKNYKTVSNSIKEKEGRPFLLIDITDGLSAKKFKTNIDIDEIRGMFGDRSVEPLSVNAILDKMLNKGGYTALTQEERDYLDANSKQ